MTASGKCYFITESHFNASPVAGIYLTVCTCLGLAIKQWWEEVSWRCQWPQVAELARNSLLSGCFTRQGESELTMGETVQHSNQLLCYKSCPCYGTQICQYLLHRREQYIKLHSVIYVYYIIHENYAFRKHQQLNHWIVVSPNCPVPNADAHRSP